MAKRKKRSQSGFIRFYMCVRRRYPKCPVTRVAKYAGRLWRQMSACEKAKFLALDGNSSSGSGCCPAPCSKKRTCCPDKKPKCCPDPSSKKRTCCPDKKRRCCPPKKRRCSPAKVRTCSPTKKRRRCRPKKRSCSPAKKRRPSCQRTPSACCPQKPRRSTGYIRFYMCMLRRYPRCPITSVAKYAGKCWRKMSSSQKEKFLSDCRNVPSRPTCDKTDSRRGTCGGCRVRERGPEKRDRSGGCCGGRSRSIGKRRPMCGMSLPVKSRGGCGRMSKRGTTSRACRTGGRRRVVKQKTKRGRPRGGRAKGSDGRARSRGVKGEKRRNRRGSGEKNAKRGCKSKESEEKKNREGGGGKRESVGCRHKKEKEERKNETNVSSDDDSTVSRKQERGDEPNKNTGEDGKNAGSCCNPRPGHSRYQRQ